MTEEEAKRVYFANYGNAFFIWREEPREVSDSFDALHLPKEKLAGWNKELFDLYFPQIRNLPSALSLEGLIHLAGTVERKALVVDFLLAEGEKNPDFMRVNSGSVILWQQGEYDVGHYFGFLEEARRADRPDLVRKYAAPFAEYALKTRETNYKNLETLISFDMTMMRAGLSSLYAGKDGEYDRRHLAEAMARPRLFPFFAYLTGFATGMGPSKAEAIRYLEFLEKSQKETSHPIYDPFVLTEPHFQFLKELAS